MFHGKKISAQIAEGLQELRTRIDAAKVPSSKLDETLNLATWNIREFGKRRRSKAAIHYIAEILGQFDLISIVELRDDLTGPGRVRRTQHQLRAGRAAVSIARFPLMPPYRIVAFVSRSGILA